MSMGNFFSQQGWNFALILLVLTVLTAIAWVADKLRFAPDRRKRAAARLAEWEREQIARGAPIDSPSRRAIQEQVLAQPWWLEYTAGLFPVILAVFLLRSFIVEPFKIPSGSMIPTLLIGDLILVNKFVYGIRLPVVHKKIIDIGQPQRGDVMVFRYPKDESLDYIKRVVGLPGDKLVYENKRLTINGEAVPLESAADFYDPERLGYTRQYSETLGNIEHKILTDLEKPSFIGEVDRFPFREMCTYHSSGLSCTVPPGHYFMMGDNRENSLDSRYWGFVPERNIVGKAFFIWMNFGDLKRIGRFH